MSSIVRIAGTALAAGLVWIPVRDESGRRYFAFQRARQLGAHLYAERARQVGFAAVGGREGGAYRGLTAAADVVARAVTAPEGRSWQAIVACEDDLFLVVQGKGSEILPEGDRVFAGEASAREACTAKTDWDAQWATPGLLAGAGQLVLDHGAVRGADLSRLRAVPLGGAGAPRRVALLGAAVLGAVASVFWFGSLKSEEPAVETVTPPAVPEPVWIAEGVPPGPFLARCLDAQAAYPPVLPQMWRLRNLGCYADTSRRHELSQLAYEQGAMVATWKAAPGANRAMARQIAERRLELWPKGQVVGSEAWAAVRFERPVHEWEGEAPRAAEFRRSIDRALATVSDELRFSYSDGLSFEARTGLALAELGRRLEGIGWLDMHEAVWLEGKWTVKGGLVQRRLVSANEEG